MDAERGLLDRLAASDSSLYTIYVYRMNLNFNIVSSVHTQHEGSEGEGEAGSGTRIGHKMGGRTSASDDSASAARFI